MSFRLFIYYCALCGAGGAFAAWTVGRLFVHSEGILGQGIKGLWLGVGIALALGLVDALWNSSAGRVLSLGVRILVTVLVGALGGLLGGVVGEGLFELAPWSIFLVLGWTLIGLLVGVSLGVFDLLASAVRGQDARLALRKILNGVLGGTLGGILGGFLSVVLHGTWNHLFENKPPERLWSPSATGFMVLGACIGLFISLAQVILKEAWLRVESGFRAGRELLLSKPEMTLGRAESCDVGLFGDTGVERIHARIQRENNNYILTDNDSAGGTFVNDERLEEAHVLRSGDRIRLGQTILRFGERKRSSQ